MNIRQKLTLGVAAIFMVTLTIVGVTYAYFVTRVTGTITESVRVKAASVGSVIYENGNCTENDETPAECDETDVITLNDILPGTTLYKSFRVRNTATASGAIGTYTVYMESWPTASTPHFVHGTVGDKTRPVSENVENNTDGNNNVCYNSESQQSNAESPTTGCFDGTHYNNVYVTLYEVSEANYNTVQNGGTITDASVLTNSVNINPVNGTTDPASYVSALAGASETGHATQDLTTALLINENTTKYYVLKVEYRNNDANQNIENDAALTLKVSIK